MRLERSTAAVSMPPARMPSASPQAKPWRCSITSTRRVTSSGCGRGTTTERCPVAAKTARRCRACSGPRAGSRAPRRWSRRTARPVRADWSVRSPGSARPAAVRSRPWRRCRAGPDRRTRLRWTLTTTRSPVRRVAAWTWAMEAEAIGVAVEGGEDLGEGSAEVLLDGAADHGERLGGDPVAEEPELLDQLLGKDALARRDDLAELDVGRAQVLEGRAQPAGQAGPRRRRAPLVGRSRRAAPHRADTGRPWRAGAARAGVRGRTRSCASAAACARRVSMPTSPSSANRHGMASGSTIQGASGVKAPMARSAGSGCPQLGPPGGLRDPSRRACARGARSWVLNGRGSARTTERTALPVVADRRPTPGRSPGSRCGRRTRRSWRAPERAPRGGPCRPRCRGGCRGRAARSRRSGG